MPAAPLVRSNPCACSARGASNQRFAGRTRTYSPHDRRLTELRRWCAVEGIPLIEAEEDADRWERSVAPIGAEARERRCRACYAMRLAEACRVAEREGFTHIATTLAVSPYQLFETCNDVLCRPHAGNPRFSPLVSRGNASFSRARDVSAELLRVPFFRCRGRA